MSKIYKAISILVIGLGYLPTNLVATEKNAVFSMETNNPKEAFAVRRIIEFWKDQDYEIVKIQINDFLSKHPDSVLCQPLKGILGDIYLHDGNYSEALSIYEQITENGVEKKIFINKLQCLYNLKRYRDLSELGYKFLSENSIEEHQQADFYFLLAEALLYQSIDMADEKMQEELALQAQKYYSMLENTRHKDSAAFAIAETFRLLKQYAQSVSHYENLMRIFPNRAEELSFQIANLQSYYDPATAIVGFKSIIEKKGDYAEKAQFNLLSLYFRLEQYANILEESKLAPIPQEQSPVYTYMIGKSYYMTKQYELAFDTLQKLLEDKITDSEMIRNSLLIQMSCNYQLNRENEFRTVLATFQKGYPEDIELPRAFFMHAILCKRMNRLDLAKEILQDILTNYPNFEDQESCLLEYALINHDLKDWRTSYSYLTEFTQRFPNSPHNISWKYYLSSCFHLQRDPDQSYYTPEQFAKDLERILQKREIFSPNEYLEYELVYAKVLYQIGQFAEAIPIFSRYIDTPGSDIHLAYAHYYMALSHYYINSHPEYFYKNMEKAIALQPSFEEDIAIQLQLFNSYISHYNQAEESQNKKDLLQHAASHLYKAYTLQSNLELSNQLWLANYFYTKSIADPSLSEHEITTARNRSKELFKNAIFDKNDQLSLNILEPCLEKEVITYAKLLHSMKEYTPSIDLLEQCLEKQQEGGYVGKYQKEALLLLAQSYHLLENCEKALETYTKIIALQPDDSTITVSDPILDEAYLQISRLKFAALSPEEKVITNPEVLTILSYLKDLQIRKFVETEPLHLEAAMEYAEIRFAIANQEERYEKYLFFLNRIKDDLLAQNDALSISYHENLRKIPEKILLYSSYLKFIDAEIFRMHANLELERNHSLESEEYYEKALALLTEIQGNNLTESLKHRVQQSIIKINQLTDYE